MRPSSTAAATSARAVLSGGPSVQRPASPTRPAGGAVPSEEQESATTASSRDAGMSAFTVPSFRRDAGASECSNRRRRAAPGRHRPNGLGAVGADVTTNYLVPPNGGSYDEAE